MSGLGPVAYLGILAATSSLTLLLVPLAMRVAIRHDVLDHPGGYKQQKSATPYLGGVAIVVAFCLAVLIAALIRPPVSGMPELVVILAGGTLVSMVGLLDDLRGLPVSVRFLSVGALAIALWASGVRVQLVDGGAADALLTVAWIVGVTNAFNLLDNMDGLSAGVAAIAGGMFFVIAALNGQFLVAALSIALVGCAIGFLRHNFHPARVYMGDAGSLFLGFLLAVIGIKLRFGAPNQITAFVPVLVLGIALFDTTLVTVTRLANRKNPFAGGRDHTSHRLVFVGIPVRAAVGLIYGAAVGLGWLALVMSRLTDPQTAYLLLGFVAAVAAFLGTLLAMVPVHERSRRRHLMIREVTGEEPGGLGAVSPRRTSQNAGR